MSVRQSPTISVRWLFVVGLVPTDLILFFQIFLQKHLQCPLKCHLALEGTSCIAKISSRSRMRSSQLFWLELCFTNVPIGIGVSARHLHYLTIDDTFFAFNIQWNAVGLCKCIYHLVVYGCFIETFICSQLWFARWPLCDCALSCDCDSLVSIPCGNFMHNVLVV